MPKTRTRLAVALVSLAVIAVELSLMRAMSLRFWSHFAYMAISVALLGFGAAAAALTLLRPIVLRRARMWLCGTALAFAAGIPLCAVLAAAVPVNAAFLAWDSAQALNVLYLELAMFVPFFLAGGFVGLVMMDCPERIGGHYAANLTGSGAGAIAAVAMMHFLTGGQLLLASALSALLAGLIMLPLRPAAIGAAIASTVAILLLSGPALHSQRVSQYKMLSYALDMPDTTVIHRAQGPLGRIDVVDGPALHYAPGLSLQYTDRIIPHVVMILDGDAAMGVYDCSRRGDWRFMDYTTSASAYCVHDQPSVLIIGAGGGSDIGLALYHRSREVVALEGNRQIIRTMTGPLAGRGGGIYRTPNVRAINAEARGFLAATDEEFDVVQLPAIDAFGASGAGLQATQESGLYTVEAFQDILDAMSERGLLCVTRWARTPPRDALRVFDIAAEALRNNGLDPAERLAMIRSWATVSVLVFARPIRSAQAASLREFCRSRSFDLCYLPGLSADEANRRHVLERPIYFEAARSLLGPQRCIFLDDYIFDVSATTDDRPYFYHFFRWRAWRVLREQLGRTSASYLETGYLMLLAALIQTCGLAAVLIVLPLALRAGGVLRAPRKAPTLAYFVLIGLGFMLLEMGFLQRLILYLADPIYAAAVTIAGFLIFAGLGSALSGRRPARSKAVGSIAALIVAAMAALYAVAIGPWLTLTQAQPTAVRFVLAIATIAPLATAMGHLLPLGMRRLAGSAAPLVPWAWGANAFASVAATVSAPLLAMSFGFARVIVIAIVCYLAAGATFVALPCVGEMGRPGISDVP